MPRARTGKAKPDHYSSRAYWALRKAVKAQEPRCAICGLPWDPAAPPRSGRSFALDHIVPISLGGSLTDRANARASHLSCNSRRGNTTQRNARRRAAQPTPVRETCRECGRPTCRRPTGFVSRCW
jgi:5-methylcytosine-specific restriction endonuclease McrA